NDRVEKFLPNGSFIRAWGSFGIGNGQFYNPYGVAIDGSNNVYVTDYFNDRVQKFDSSGNFLLKWGSSGPGNGQFSNPTGIAVDSSGSIYVADTGDPSGTGNNRVEVFAPTVISQPTGGGGRRPLPM